MSGDTEGPVETTAEKLYYSYREGPMTSAELEKYLESSGAEKRYFNDGVEGDAWVFSDRSWIVMYWGSRHIYFGENWDDWPGPYLR